MPWQKWPEKSSSEPIPSQSQPVEVKAKSVRALQNFEKLGVDFDWQQKQDLKILSNWTTWWLAGAFRLLASLAELQWVFQATSALLRNWITCWLSEAKHEVFSLFFCILISASLSDFQNVSHATINLEKKCRGTYSKSVEIVLRSSGTQQRTPRTIILLRIRVAHGLLP